VKECRRAILAIAHFIVRSQFRELHFQLLMSHIISVSDPSEKVDLLDFLCGVIIERSILRENIIVSFRRLKPVQYLFNLPSPDLFMASLRVIVDAHTHGFIREFSLQVHIDIILHQMGADAIKPSLLTSIIEITKKGLPYFPLFRGWLSILASR
jgi:hypothetical protein